jgi:hypothetical protein
MSETGVLSGTEASAMLDIDKDSDRFFVRIPGGASMGNISIKVSSSDNTNSTYNDNATQIDLHAYGNDAISKSMLLVSDDVDDDYAVDSVADDEIGDRTHMIQLGRNFKIESIKIGANAWQSINVKIAVPVMKTVKVKFVNCQKAAISPCWTQSEITIAKKFMEERYAQTGIKLEFSEIAGPWISVSGWLAEGQFPTEVINGILSIPQKTKDIVDQGPFIQPTEVAVYLVTRLDGSGIYSYHGVSIPPTYLGGLEKIVYGNKILVGSAGSGYSNNFTSSHELLHILLDAVHGVYQTEFDDPTMLWHTPGTNNNSIIATKRISQKQDMKILTNQLAK